MRERDCSHMIIVTNPNASDNPLPPANYSGNRAPAARAWATTAFS